MQASGARVRRLRVFRDAWDRHDLPRGTVVAVGNFDGIHRGQQAVLRKVSERAQELGVTSAVVTFDPHPKKVLRPGEPLLRLTTPAQKEELIGACGIDALISVRFSAEVAATPAESFVREFLAGRLGAIEVHVGATFSFGHGRAGNLDLLRALGGELGFAAVGVDEMLYGGEAISSTRIRRALLAGEPEPAAAMLGRPYSVSGEVVHGDARGRELGWPTANLACESELLPRDGVYAAALRLRDEAEPMPGVANVGVRPTVDDSQWRIVEIHLFDFAGNLYEQRVEVLFCRRLRTECRFPSLEALRDQIERDASEAREYFAHNRCWNEGADA